MTDRAELMERAAESYTRAGLPLDAARCYREAGLLLEAARCFERAGERLRAAETYRQAGVAYLAAPLYIELGRPQEAAECHESAGDMLQAGWVLALHTARTAQAYLLLSEVDATRPAVRLRRSLGIALCTTQLRGDPAPLVRAVQECEAELHSIDPLPVRRTVLEWAVQAADHIGRHDLAARLFAAAYRARTVGVLPWWRAWATATLGDTLGLPEQPLAEKG